jgi:hypothetical protein
VFGGFAAEFSLASAETNVVARHFDDPVKI